MREKKHTDKELQDFGIWAKKRMIEKNMTGTELAKSIGANRTFVSKILNGHRPGYGYRDQIRNILGERSGGNDRIESGKGGRRE